MGPNRVRRSPCRLRIALRDARWRDRQLRPRPQVGRRGGLAHPPPSTTIAATTRPAPPLAPAAKAFRAVHALIALGFLAAIAHVWLCAITGRRDRWLHVAIAALGAEGAVVALNRGDCPLGPLQARAGDPVPLFELALSPRAAKRAVPTLGVVAAAGIALVARRRPAT